MIKVHQFRSPRGCLSYAISVGSECILLDPSVEVADAYLKFLEDNSYTLKYIVESHTHADHIAQDFQIRAATGAKILMHENASSPRKDMSLKDGDRIKIGDSEVKVIYTPGHTNDHISLVAGNNVFTGDALLIGGTGRTDFQRGSSADLYDSLWNKIIPLGDHMRVYPAHNYKGLTHSTIGDEKKNNPRLQMSREEFIERMDAHHPPKPELFETALKENTR